MEKVPSVVAVCCANTTTDTSRIAVTQRARKILVTRLSVVVHGTAYDVGTADIHEHKEEES